MCSEIFKNYIALLVIIILWVSIWAIADSVSKLYMRSHTDRIKFCVIIAVVASVILLVFFPSSMKV